MIHSSRGGKWPTEVADPAMVPVHRSPAQGARTPSGHLICNPTGPREAIDRSGSLLPVGGHHLCGPAMRSSDAAHTTSRMATSDAGRYSTHLRSASAFPHNRGIVRSSSVVSDRGSSCWTEYRRQAAAPVIPLANQRVKNLLLSKRRVTTIRGSQIRRGTCSAAIPAWRCTFSWRSRPPAATATPAGSAPFQSINSAAWFTASRANLGCWPSWKAAPSLGGLNCKDTDEWALRLTRRAESPAVASATHPQVLARIKSARAGNVEPGGKFA